MYLAVPGLLVAAGIFDLHCNMQSLLAATWGIFTYGSWNLNCSMWDLVPWLGIKPRPPVLGAWHLSHWTARAVPTQLFSEASFPITFSSHLDDTSLLPVLEAVRHRLSTPLLLASRKEHLYCSLSLCCTWTDQVFWIRSLALLAAFFSVPQEAAPVRSNLPCLPAPSGIWPMGVTGRRSGRRMRGSWGIYFLAPCCVVAMIC